MSDEKLAALCLSLVTTVVILFAGLGLLAAVYHPAVDLNGLLTIYNGKLSSFKPEPQERALYLTGITTLPFLLFGTYTLYHRLLGTMDRQSLANLAAIVSACLVAALICFSWFVFANNRYYFVNTIGTSWPALTGTILAAIGYIWLLTAPDKNGRTGKLLEPITGALAAAIGVMASLYCIIGLESVEDTFNYLSHFNAVFHAVVQVHLGKQLLVDLINQYGLYPHFIEPFFRIFGLSVLKYTLLMALLLAAAYAGLYRFLRQSTHNRTIANLGFVALVYACYLRGAGTFFDNYYQYHPVRILFPALSIYLVGRYLASGRRQGYLPLFLLGSTAVLWNLDTGVVVLLSWVLLLLYTECRNGVPAMARHLLVAITVFLLTVGSYAGLQYLVYGHWPDFTSFLVYQRLFYVSGFFMLPMPLWHPWNLIVLVYAVGLLIALADLAGNEVTARSASLFYLAVLGFGLFSYYQGRSHDDCLPLPSYPAVIMITLYADALSERLPRIRNLAGRTLLLLLLAPMLFCAASFVNEAPAIASLFATRMTAVSRNASTYLKRNIDCIKGNIVPGEKPFLLTYHSGIISLATGVPYPLRVAGPSEMLLVSDCAKVAQYLASGEARKVFVDKAFLEDYEATPTACREISTVLDRDFTLNYINPFVLPGEKDAMAIYMMLPRK